MNASGKIARSTEAECAGVYKRSVFALRRGSDFAGAAGDAPVEARDFRQVPSPAPIGSYAGGQKRLPRRGLLTF
jgi:hypothetical protein